MILQFLLDHFFKNGKFEFHNSIFIQMCYKINYIKEKKNHKNLPIYLYMVYSPQNYFP